MNITRFTPSKLTPAILGCTLAELLAEGEDLFREHREEVGGRAFDDMFSVDVAAYVRDESAGRLIILAAWDEELSSGYAVVRGPLVGYSVSRLHGNPNNLGEMQCHCTAIYVRSEFRSKGLGTRLIDMTEYEADRLGLAAMVWRAPVGGPLEPVLEGRSSCRLAEKVFVREFKTR